MRFRLWPLPCRDIAAQGRAGAGRIEQTEGVTSWLEGRSTRFRHPAPRHGFSEAIKVSVRKREPDLQRASDPQFPDPGTVTLSLARKSLALYPRR